jgi:hypothetical protein
VGDNWYHYVDSTTYYDYGSVGTNLGVIYRVNEDLSIGGVAGAEWAQRYLERYRSVEDSVIYIYPRLAVFSSLRF